MKAHEEYEQMVNELETLRAENAKLIAERDDLLAEQIAYGSVCDSLLTLGDELRKLRAEREQWMRHEPVALAHIRMQDDGPEIDIEVWDGTDLQPEMTPIKLYTRPLPAQQDKRLGSNQYGLDMGYLVGKLNILIRDVRSYKPDEAARTLARLALVADENVLREPEFSVQQVAVLEGYVLVPIEPTIEMVMIGEKAAEDQLTLRCSDEFNMPYPSEDKAELTSRTVYKAMLSAAPKLEDKL